MNKQRKIWYLVILASLFLIVFIWLVHWGNKRNSASHAEIIQLGQIVATIYRMNSAIAIMQENSTGYYLTGDPYFRKRQAQVSARLDSLARSTRQLTNDAAIKQRIDTLQGLLKTRQALSDSIIYWYDHHLLSGEKDFFKKAFLLADQYDTYYRQVFNEESGILKTRIKENYHIIHNTLLALLSSGSIALIGVLIVFWRINKIFLDRKRQAEKKIQEGEYKYRKLIDNARVVLFTTNVEGIFTFVNGRAKSIMGYTAEELVGKTYKNLIAPEYLAQVENNYKQQRELNLSESEFEFPILRKDGEIKWVEQMCSLMYDEKENLTGFQCIIKDIDEQKRLQLDMKEIEDNKREYQLLLQAILDYSPSLIFVKDIDSKYLIINKKFENIFRLIGRDIIGKDDNVFNSVDASAGFHADDQWVIRNKEQKRVVQVLDTPAGPRNYMVTKFPLMKASGEVGGVCGIAVDISDQIQREKELELARQKAEEAEKTQEHFLAHVSHEIRTPLNGIMGMTGLLKETALTEEQEDYVKIIFNSSETLLYLINDLLDTAKIKAGKISLEHIEFNLKKTIAKTVSGLQYRAKEKGLEFITKMAGEIPDVLMGDPYRLTQILLNLLVNSIKFTATGSVTLATSMIRKDKELVWIQFDVRDTGIGIPSDKIDGLFKEFNQVHTDTTRKYGGTGLGLHITEKLVKLQNGFITVTSELGGGSCFSIQIPYAYNDNESSAPGVNTSQLKGNELKGLTILSVEDNEINQKVTGRILQKANANALFAANGKEAIASLKQHPVDLVLMDLMMPEMDGFEATEIIRKELKLNMPIIVLTGTALKTEQERCMDIGASAYLTKPFSAFDLLNLINNLLKKEAD